MAKCDKCDGFGWKDNPKYWNAIGDWKLQYEPTIKCRACKGTGYVIADFKDAINILQVWKNNPRGIDDKDFKLAVEILEKIFD